MQKSRLVIVDYGMGNLRSVQKAFEACGAPARVTSSRREIERARKIVLPGVGAFDHAMARLKKLGILEPLKGKIQAGTPYLGICLGLQLLFSRSEEGRPTPGMNLIPGIVKKFRGKLKIPHMGWNTLRSRREDCPLFKGIGGDDYFYFVHSYFGVPDDPSWSAAVTRYGTDFASVVWKGNLFATQFHPEKSQAAGLRLVRNFMAVP